MTVLAHAGATVVVRPNFGNPFLAKVKKVTPTGRIVLESGAQYSPQGHRLGESYFSSLIENVTPKALAEIRTLNLRNRIKNFDYKTLSREQLEAINLILRNQPSPEKVILMQIVNDLPQNKDWLDPAVEEAARKLVQDVNSIPVL